jgi:Protein of unknown function (DUF2442)
MRPDPMRYYVATRNYSSPATQQHLPRPGVVTPGMKLRGDHPVVIERPETWVDAADDPNTAALAQALAGRPRVLLTDGRKISVPLQWFPRLIEASPRERRKYELIGDGTLIHWPAVDEDIDVPNLLRP